MRMMLVALMAFHLGDRGPRLARVAWLSAALGLGCAGNHLGSEAIVLGRVAPGDSVIILAAGDIASCGSEGDELTAALLDTLSGIVLAMGDNAYRSGSGAEYRDCYQETWGRHLQRTWAAPGNHDYQTAGAQGLFAYYGDRAGPPGRGFFSVDLPGWRLLMLNSSVAMTPESEQGVWLSEQLRQSEAACVLAVIHHPRFSSGLHGNNRSVLPLWRALEQGGADLVLSGHDHIYERFRPLTADGAAPAEGGLRSFVVGTGGAHHTPLLLRAPGSVTRLEGRWGVLRLTLRAGRYEWEFITAPGGERLDHGEDRCR